MSRHRFPPMPEYPGAGFCRWCTGEIFHPAVVKRAGERNVRRGWHDGRGAEPNCLGAYFLATKSEHQRAACWGRDHGVCRECGVDASAPERARLVRRGLVYGWGDEGSYSEVVWQQPWQADHIVALVNVDRSLSRDQILQYWSLDNLQTLCNSCHARKSGADRKQRNAHVRANARASGSHPRRDQGPLAPGPDRRLGPG